MLQMQLPKNIKDDTLFFNWIWSQDKQMLNYKGVKEHKYSSLSKKTREIFTPVVHTTNRKTWCRARVWSIKALSSSLGR